MKYFSLKEYGSDNILYEGLYGTIRDCVEQAVRERVILKSVNLQGANLVNAELDEGMFPNARFDNANLTGANVSAAKMQGAVFSNAVLHSVCFCEADLTCAQFFGTSFGATDIAWANLSIACFDTLSALDLSFSEAMTQKESLFYDRTGPVCRMSRAPVVLKGLRYPVVMFDDHMKVGSAVLPYEYWHRLKQDHTALSLEADLKSFILTYLDFFIALIEVRQPENAERLRA